MVQYFRIFVVTIWEFPCLIFFNFREADCENILIFKKKGKKKELKYSGILYCILAFLHISLQQFLGSLAGCCVRAATVASFITAQIIQRQRKRSSPFLWSFWHDHRPGLQSLLPTWNDLWLKSLLFVRQSRDYVQVYYISGQDLIHLGKCSQQTRPFHQFHFCGNIWEVIFNPLQNENKI